jgi:hypothetical protein
MDVTRAESRPTKPRFIHGAMILLWGLHSDLILAALPLAIVLEARHLTTLRWDLDKSDFYRVADLTGIAFVAMVVYLLVNARETHFIITMLQWLPILFYPLLIVHALSLNSRMSLDVLFYSLRKQKAPVTQSWDLDYLHLGLCFIAIGTSPDASLYFLPLIAAVTAVALFPLRPDRYATSLWVLLLCAAFLGSYGGALVLREAHLALKERTAHWLANYLSQRTDPLKTRTGLGAVGRMKLSDRIMFRVAAEGTSQVPRLLREAAYDLPVGTDWMVLNAGFRTVAPVGDFLWSLAPPRQVEHSMQIFREFDTPQDIIPVPPSVTAVDNLPAVELKQSRFGTVQGAGLVPSPGYRVRYDFAGSVGQGPQPSDLYIPEEFVGMLDGVTVATGPDPLTRVRRHFNDFRYSLFRPHKTDTPLADFLFDSRAGHCEYFASSTVLLLRKLGVPARYVVGYAVEEFSPSLGMYVVRQRHAHAWAIAWLDGRWQAVDTTPSVWLDSEAAAAGTLTPLGDLISNGLFLTGMWWERQRMEDYEPFLYLIGVLLSLYLAFRIARSDQVHVDQATSDQALASAGHHSPFYRIEAALTAVGLTRHTGEAMSHWLRRIDHIEALPILTLHYRVRFDPSAAAEDHLAELTSATDVWEAEFRAPTVAAANEEEGEVGG